MAPLLNKFSFLLILLTSIINGYSQGEESNTLKENQNFEKDYQEKTDFKKYRKRAEEISAWQIQNLKFGAIVVRFQNNNLKIEACKRIGDIKREKEIRAETQFYIKTMMKAFALNFNFCKVYFMYAQSSDSLLKGVRKGIFIDSSLKVNNEIVMTEKFYLLAEKDYVYNSSIGFVKEDTAKFVRENGPKTIDVAVVLKNKYGHQLKTPFPFFVKRAFLKSSSQYLNVTSIETSPGKFENISYWISKDITLEKQGEYLEELNLRLIHFHDVSKGAFLTDKSIQPFLY